jgi:hypothetical protein
MSSRLDRPGQRAGGLRLGKDSLSLAAASDFVTRFWRKIDRRRAAEGRGQFPS